MSGPLARIPAPRAWQPRLVPPALPEPTVAAAGRETAP